jgi:type I restriction enzyme, S subunit
MSGQKVAKGYKQTEVGVIPEDWEYIEIGQLDPFVTSGSRGWAEFYAEYGAPFIRITNMTRESISLDLSDLKCVQLTDGTNEGKRTQLSNGDLLISITADVGIISYVDDNLQKPAYINQHIALLRFDDKKVDSQFLSYFLSHENSQKWFRGGSDQGAKTGMNLTTIRQIKAALPTIAEQKQIARALSDIDALIEGLEGAIGKKRQIKQGAMQELLRSKDGWVVAKLKEVAPLQRGFDLPSNQLKRGIYPVVYSNGIQNHHNQSMVKGPGVTTGRSGTLGVVNFVSEDFWPHNTTLWVTDFRGNDPKFIYYLYTHIGFDRFGTGSGVPTLNRNDAHDYSASIPSELKEQQAIATILSDMDNAIATLEAKLTKTRQLKQGMMHELLTGRIRLV